MPSPIPASACRDPFESLKYFSEVAHFTHYTVGHAHLGAYGFFTMIMFGAIYYILPRVTGWEWASATMIRWHFWLTSTGIVLYFTSLTIGGWYQGLANKNYEIPWVQISLNTIPYLWAEAWPAP